MSPTHSVALASKGKSKASVLPPSRLPVLHSRSTSLEKRITDDALKPISKSSLPGHGPGKPGPSSFPAASKLLTMTAPTLATLTTSPITVTAFTAASTHDNERNLTPPIHPSENADEPSLEESNIRMLRLGMERGYTLSPMAHLWLELLKVPPMFLSPPTSGWEDIPLLEEAIIWDSVPSSQRDLAPLHTPATPRCASRFHLYCSNTQSVANTLLTPPSPSFNSPMHRFSTCIQNSISQALENGWAKSTLSGYLRHVTTSKHSY
ncbi:hypothetical protein M413DRAFT_25971 [Hebeloma cylindrosporum]|uniref:Uncharacterized protein n=1 Tax=Hebeloma cylindrosporum TaxID=76867 RepID=A0A0C2Y1E0_HEBCY|nr:hypothetical protein M413DRAFT_25971 [Hebeloma cylindrosporum h7]